jgi:hypothetical protein
MNAQILVDHQLKLIDGVGNIHTATWAQPENTHENSLHRKLLTTEAHIRERQANDSLLVPVELCPQVIAEPHQPRQLSLLVDKVAC